MSSKKSFSGAQDQMAPLISVFIVNYNTRSLLERCLTSIFHTKGQLGVEVFVADNNSTDGSHEMVEAMFPQVLVTRYAQNVGYTRAINQLLPLAKGDYYLFLHPDLEILPNTLRRFVDFFEKNLKAGVLGGNLYYPNGTPNPCEVLFPGFKNDLLCLTARFLGRLPVIKKTVRKLDYFHWSHESTSQVNWVWNACMIVRREVFHTIGYFDESFFVWFADWDLCKRASDVGWSIYYVHSAVAIHYERHSSLADTITQDEVLYKIDGWYSAVEQIKDRHVFLKKYLSPGSVYGIKGIYILENLLQLWLVLGHLILRKSLLHEASFQARVCLKTIHSVLRA